MLFKQYLFNIYKTLPYMCPLQHIYYVKYLCLLNESPFFL